MSAVLEQLATQASATKTHTKTNNQKSSRLAPLKAANGQSEPLSTKKYTTGLKGVYVALNRVSRQPTGSYRAAILPPNELEWITLGYFYNKDTAAYVFNVYAINCGLYNLVNHDIKPDKTELEQWRAKTTTNVSREQSARTKYNLLWGKHGW
jgi:hypothetical protein